MVYVGLIFVLRFNMAWGIFWPTPDYTPPDYALGGIVWKGVFTGLYTGVWLYRAMQSTIRFLHIRCLEKH